LGDPLFNTKLYVVDEHLQLVPHGVIGELCIGGRGVARGYLGNPVLSEARFLKDPYASEPGARLYKTGDFVRRHSDGYLEFLGRADNQVKIGGFRIELGEVEGALERQTGVSQAVAVAMDSATGGKQLIVAWTGEAKLESILLEGMARLIPAYMLPSRLIHLSSLPLLTSGKVDRKTLATLIKEQPPDKTPDRTAPRNEMERALATIWESILGLQGIGVEDRFVPLGGDSLGAATVASRIKKQFSIPLTAVDVLKAASLEDLAKKVSTLKAVPAERLNQIEHVRDDQPVPLTGAQRMFWMAEQANPGAPVNKTSRFITLEGALDLEALRRSLETLWNRHEALRSCVRVIDGKPCQLPSSRSFELPVVDLTGKSEAEREQALEKLVQTVWGPVPNLENGDVFRLRLAQLGPARNVLMLLFHHCMVDGLGVALFMRELSQLYAASKAKKPLELPETTSMRSFASWELHHASKGRALDRTQYMQSCSRPSPIFLPKCFNGRREETGKHPYDACVWQIPEDVFRLLRKNAREQEVTMVGMLMAMINIAFHCESGLEDFVIGGFFANRRTDQAQRIVGQLVQPVPIRVRMAAGDTVWTAVSNMKAAILRGIEHEDVTWDVPNRTPLLWNQHFGVLFNSDQDETNDLVLEGLHVSAEELSLKLSPLPRMEFPLELLIVMQESAQGGRVIVGHAPKQVPTERISHMLKQVEWICRAATASPARTLGELTEELRAGGLLG
jgi:acyl carrier protein